ncbi:triosephosphate isomerase [Trebonia kvetii]|uniref:Triosephosphate isomerase n=2 Tax=Trebonia kvetii TaxID=2480626 RepID=A0A6P2BKH0_9ACTN|nr:triosephosphate isomerase [Trebonia kvetii]
MYLSHAETIRWLDGVARLRTGSVEVAVLPSFTALPAAAQALAGTAIRYGAQDCCWADAGPFTGEVSPAVLRELGCSYVEVGHAERRRHFGEDDAMVARKAAAAVAAGLVPIVCIGEPGRCGPAEAARACARQLAPVVAATGNATVIVAYEPVWAIGAAEPADPGHVLAVLADIRARAGKARIIYGGSAGPGLFKRLPGVDGLFLGRSALDLRGFARTLAELAA